MRKAKTKLKVIGFIVKPIQSIFILNVAEELKQVVQSNAPFEKIAAALGVKKEEARTLS